MAKAPHEVVMRDTGGGFGQKVVPMREDMCIMLAARKVPAALKWIEDRRENLIAAGQARHVDGTARICELVEYALEDIDLKGAWTGPAQLELTSHALAPVGELPVLEVVSAMHIIADLTLPLGKVVHDYLG